MLLKITNEYGQPLNLSRLEYSRFYFGYENGTTLEKNNARVISSERGELELDLTDFEVAGLPLGEQDLTADLYFPGWKYSVLFAKGVNVVMINEKRAIKAS